jgi:hypothetical protein
MWNMTEDTATPEPDVDGPPLPVDVIRALGYEPDAVQALIITADSVVAVDAQYPEPLTRQE